VTVVLAVTPVSSRMLGQFARWKRDTSRVKRLSLPFRQRLWLRQENADQQSVIHALRVPTRACASTK